MNKPLIIVSVALCAIGCEEKPPPISSVPANKGAAPAAMPKLNVAPSAPVAPAAPTGAPQAALSGNSLSALGLNLTMPEGWKGMPPSNAMRLAEAQVPDASGDAAKACLVTFSAAGGDVASNMERWSTQVRDGAGNPVKGEIKTRTVSGMNVHTVELVGAFQNMGESTPHANWMLRGAVVETPGGLLFVKMMGPVEQMNAQGAAFNAMLDGIKK